MNQGFPEIKVKLLFADSQTSFVAYLPAHLRLGHLEMFFLN